MLRKRATLVVRKRFDLTRARSDFLSPVKEGGIESFFDTDVGY